MPLSLSPAQGTQGSAPQAPRPALIGQAHSPFLARLQPGAHLLEAGCGAGEDLHHFRTLGFMVTAFDASLNQASAASRLCGQPVRVCRFEQMHNVLPYDGIWASGSLPCLTEDELAPALMHLAGLLKPQGPLYCSFPYGESEPASHVPPSQEDYPLLTRLDALPVPEQMLNRDLWIMLATALLPAPFLFRRWPINRPVGAAFIAAYGLYVGAML